MKIEIEWSEDSHDCETCGTSWASGAVVTFDGGVVIDRPALAHCYDSQHIDQEEVYKEIIEKLGHTIVDNYNT